MPIVTQASQDDRQPEQDFEMGFWTGAIHGYVSRYCVLSRTEQELKAFSYFTQETKAGATCIGAYIEGWLAGYAAYFDGLI